MKMNTKGTLPNIRKVEDIYEIMMTIFQREHALDETEEHFWTIALNPASKILNIELLAIGSHKRVTVAPIDVFSIPLQKQATGLILVHNHPSGQVIPSKAELDFTNKLIQGGVMLDCPIIESMIIAPKGYYSFAKEGDLEALRWDNKYALTFVREKQLKQELEKNKKELIKRGLEKGVKAIEKLQVQGLLSLDQAEKAIKELLDPRKAS